MLDYNSDYSISIPRCDHHNVHSSLFARVARRRISMLSKRTVAQTQTDDDDDDQFVYSYPVLQPIAAQLHS